MELKLDINFKFKPGDIVELKNDNNEQSLFAQVKECCAFGEFESRNDNVLEMNISRNYNVVVQIGSCHDDKDATPLRPGLYLVFDDVFENGKLITDFDIPVIEMDTLGNISDRKKQWDEFIEGWKSDHDIR